VGPAVVATAELNRELKHLLEQLIQAVVVAAGMALEQLQVNQAAQASSFSKQTQVKYAKNLQTLRY
jgi:hypothetical protein